MHSFLSWLGRLTLKTKVLASLTALLFVVAAVAPSPAIADGLATLAVSDQPATASEVGVTIGATINAVAQAVVGAFEGLVKNESLQAGGKTITYTLFAIVFAWNLVRTMVQGEGVNGLVAELVPMIGTLVIIVALLDAGGVGQIIQFMDSVASTFGASGGLGPDVLAAIKKGSSRIGGVSHPTAKKTAVTSQARWLCDQSSNFRAPLHA